MTDFAPRMAADGKAAIRHRDIFGVALPIMLSNVTTPLIGVVDAAVLGQLGDPHYIGAVAIGATIFSILFWAFGFLRMGTTGLTAQARGAEDDVELQAVFWRALMVAGIAGVILITSQLLVARIAFNLIEASVAVETAAGEYFAIRIWSAPFALANYALLGWFIGRGRAGTAFALQLLLNGLNVFLDALFVLVFAWGVAGVAIGTVMAEITAALAGLWLFHQYRRGLNTPVGRARLFDAARLKRTFAVNADIMIRTLCLTFAFAWFMAQSAKTDDIILAANAILFQLFTVTAYFLDGFAFAAEVFVGRAVGARNLRQFRETVLISSLWAAIISIGIGAIFWLAGGFIIDRISVNPDVREAARVFLIWGALSPVVGVAAFQLDGIYIGATWTRDMRNMMIVSLIVFLAAGYVLVPVYGNHGLWASLMVFFLIRAITLGLRYPVLERHAFTPA